MSGDPYRTAAALRDAALELSRPRDEPVAMLAARCALPDDMPRVRRFTIDNRRSPHKRFFWRVRYRYGELWWNMTDAQIARELRAMSWRRAL